MMRHLETQHPELKSTVKKAFFFRNRDRPVPVSRPCRGRSFEHRDPWVHRRYIASNVLKRPQDYFLFL
jgi:hypothetical protein